MKELAILVVLLTVLSTTYANLLWPQDVVVREGQNLLYEGAVVQEPSGAVYNFWVYQKNGQNCLMASKHSSTGESLWPEPVLVKGGMDLKTSLRTARSSDGGILLCWIERHNAHGYNLCLQKLSPSGNMLWGEGGVSVCAYLGNTPEYLMTPNQTGGAYLFVYMRPMGTSHSSFACSYNSEGTEIWGTEHTSITYNDIILLDEIVAPPTGNGMLVLYRFPGSEGYLRAFRHYNSAGESDWMISEAATYTDTGAFQLLSRNAQKVNVFTKDLATSTSINIRTLNLETGTWIQEEESQIMLNPISSNYKFGYKAVLMQDIDTVSLICWYRQNEVNYVSQTLFDLQMQPLETRSIYATSGSINSLIVCHDEDSRTFCMWEEFPQESYSRILKAQAIADEDGDLLFPSSGFTISNTQKGLSGYGMVASNGTMNTFFGEPGEEASSFKHRTFDSAGNSLLPSAQEILTTNLNGHTYQIRCLDIANHAISIYGDSRKQGQTRIYCQQLNEEGQLMFSPGGLLIGSGVQNQFHFYDAIRYGDDRFAVLFENACSLYIQIYDLDGNALFENQGLCLSQNNSEHARMAVYMTDIYISWSEPGSISGTKILGQKISGNQTVWGLNGITIADNLTNYSSLGAPVGRYYTWALRNEDTHQNEVKAIRMDGFGNPSPGWAVEGNTVFQATMTEALSLNDVGLSGRDLLLYLQTNAIYSVYGQRVNSNGDVPWGLSGVLIHGSQRPVLDALVDEGGITIGYRMHHGVETRLLIQNVSPEGSLMYPEPGLALDMADARFATGMSLGRFPNGGLLVAWRASYDVGSPYSELYYRKFNSAGEALEAAPQILCDAPLDQESPLVAASSGNALYVSWKDARSGSNASGQNSYGIHMQKLSYDVPVSLDEPQVPATVVLKPCYPNPFSTSVNINWSQKDSTPSQCFIYNIRGQLVKSFLITEAKSGEHHVLWDGDDIRGRKVSPGVYIIKVQSGDWTSSRKVLKWK